MISFLKIQNKNTIIFIISVVIATFMWLLIKLSKEYEIVIQVPIEYVNMPSDKVLIKSADSVLRINIIDNGFDLLGNKISSTYKLYSFDVNTFRSQKISANKTKYYNLTNTFYDRVKSEFGSSSKITQIKPDSLVLIFEKLASKKVKITADISIDLAPQYQLSKETKLSPDSVMLFGSEKELSKTDSISTENLKYKDLDKDIHTKLSLLIPKHIKSQINNVQLDINIEKFTEASLEVPIQTNLPKNVQVKIFPKQVKIKYAIALDHYHLIKTNQFQVLGVRDSLSVGKLNISLKKFPEHIRVIDYSPKMAEYIIIK